MKTVYKPWGREEWLELNDKYCYKRIYINAGHRTSYQYHMRKTETNYIIEGSAEVWLENDQGVVDKSKMTAGDFFTVVPGRKHRVIAITDIILQEVSTPEVDDVIRLEDDAKRDDGAISHEHMHPALCILAAGKGTRLDYLAATTNKGLLPLQDKAVISHIIDKTPTYFDVVIAVGYKADMVKEYCAAVHADRNIIFVDVPDYDGPNSGPGASFLACAKYLRRPFYLSTADCIVEESLPSLENNWLGISPTSIPELYSTVNIESDFRIVDFSNKSPHGFDNAFIGLCGIRDYDNFIANVKNNELVSAFDDVSVYTDLYGEPFHWHDIGTIDGYIKARELFGNTGGLEKLTTQTFYKIDRSIVKTNTDVQLVSNVVERSKILEAYVPPLKFAGRHTYSYDWVDGYTLYELNVPTLYMSFVSWCFLNLWSESADVSLRNECEIFYKDKTYDRLKTFLSSKPEFYAGTNKVNGVQCKPIYDCVDNIDWGLLYDAWPTKLFHGDLQFDNVIYLDETYTFIDWRESFGGNTVYGDAFYDMAKLYGGMCMSYASMKDPSNFDITVSPDEITYGFYCPQQLDTVRTIFENQLLAKGWLNKIKLMKSLIYLNMAPLHPGSMGDILFFHALQGLQNDHVS